MNILKRIIKNVLIDQFSKNILLYINNNILFNTITWIQFWGNTRMSLFGVWLLICLLVVLICLIYIFREDDKISYGLIFIFSGAMSNFLDFIFKGFVIDWIHVGGVVFNLADIFMLFGIGFIIFHLMGLTKN